MRPEKGLEEEMDEKHQDPRELFVAIGLLITEARTPDISPKGRVEGPHCPPVSGTNDHTCDRHKEQCRKAGDLVSQQDILWQNKIPMRIDVLLFPDCEHGLREETIVEGASFGCDEHFELLERWDIQLIKKRSTEKLGGFILGRVHLQAVRSYLHFSQLSSWLISRAGSLPLRVIHRIYAPGETVDYNFSQLPEVHKFPSADLGELVLSTTVAHLPRSKMPVSLQCRFPSLNFEQHLRYKQSLISGDEKKSKFTKEPSPSTSSYSDGYSEKIASRNIMDCEEKSNRPTVPKKADDKPPSGKKLENQSSEKAKMKLQPCPLSKTPKRKIEQMSPTLLSPDKFPFTSENGPSAVISSILRSSCSSSDERQVPGHVPLATIPEPSMGNSAGSSPVDSSGPCGSSSGSCDSSVKCVVYQKPATLTVSTGNTHIISKRLPSPKVLVTGTGKPEPTMYKKRCLEVAFGSRIDEKAKDFDAAFEKLKEYTAREIHDLVKPLSPSDLEAYLSSLSNNAQRIGGVSKIDDIPTTKCSFFLGENTEDTISLSSEDISTKSDTADKKVDKELCTSINSAVESPPHSSDSLSEDTMDGKTDSQRDTPCIKPEQSECQGTVQPKHVRALFQKSLSTSEVEEEVFHTRHPTNDSHKCQANLQFHFKDKCWKDETATANENISETPPSAHVIDSKYANRLVCHDGLDHKKETGEKNTDLHQREDTNTKTCANQSKNIQSFSIPCKIGSVSQTVSTLVQNMEAMDIDDEQSESVNVQPKAAQQMLVGSPVLDLEVEKHLSASNGLVANGATQSPAPPSNTSPAQSCDNDSFCDTNPTAKRIFSLSLCKQLLQKEFQQTVKNEILSPGRQTYKNLPSPDDITNYRCMMGRSTSAIFNVNTGLPSRSSPAPMKKKNSSHFEYDCSLTNVRAIKNAVSCSKLTLQSENNSDDIEDPKVLSTSAPASTNCLLGNFEESVLNGRIEPVGVVDGFTVEIGAGGLFCPKHVVLPVAAYFFQLSDDNAPSPYLGHVNLEPLGKRGYHIPRTGTVQVTLFNPNKTVVKMFVVLYDLSDMPANCQTFLRQRTIYMPVDKTSTEPSYLRYLIHLRFASSKSGKVYLHTDIRLIFARDKFEFDPQVASYELRSFTEGPQNPKFSPRR